MKRLDQQVVVLLGASSGVGRDAALRFSRRGARVVAAARDEEALRSLVDEIRRDGGDATALATDVTDFAQVEALAETARQHYGGLDTWVQLASVFLSASVEQTTPEEFRRVIEVDLLGAVHGAMAALPYLRREGGALIFLSSMAAKRSAPLHAAYSAAKHGTEGFLEALRVELMHDRVPVSVTSIRPATLNTPLFDKGRSKLGVKGIGPPPFYQPQIASEAILYAAEHPVRDIRVGGASRMIELMQCMSPRLVDLALARIGYRIQRTQEPQSPDSPDNLFSPLSDHGRVEGQFTEVALKRSAYTWLELHPKWRGLVLATAVAGGAAIAQRMSSR